MKKVLFCAVLAAVMAFSVGGCKKQQESKEKAAVSETTNGTPKEVTEQKEAPAQQAGTEQPAEMQQKSGDMTAPEPSATEEPQAGEKEAGSSE
jgi:hypothetical protein